MRADRRYCDGLFDLIEPLALAGKWGAAGQASIAFGCALQRHFEREERVLFPALEEVHGAVFGTACTLRTEHSSMRALLTDVDAAMVRSDAKKLAAVMETLRIAMQQHNLKEENVLYPMADALSAGQAGDLLQALERRPTFAR